MPTCLQGSPWLFVPVIAPLILMVFWLFRVRFMPWSENPKVQRGKTVPQFSWSRREP